jgi:hypothetical protein
MAGGDAGLVGVAEGSWSMPDAAPSSDDDDESAQPDGGIMDVPQPT